MISAARRGGPRRAALVASFCAQILLGAGRAFALDPSLDVSQYAHTAWKARDGFIQGRINSIAQTADGYLWLGTEFGLRRFDGVRTVPFVAAGELPSPSVLSLLVAQDGTLWIGTSKGLASWHGGKLTQYPETAGRRIANLLQDREGTVWFGAAPTNTPLCCVRAGKTSCEEAGALGQWFTAVYEDHRGTLWVLEETGLWRWRPGPPQQYRVPAGLADLTEDEGGSLLLAALDGLKRFSGGDITDYPVSAITPVSRPARFLRSRDGSLWIGTNNGLVHVHHGRSETFGAAQGLSGDVVFSMREDSEGSLWVSTGGGLDRFRDYSFPRISVDQGLSSSFAWAVLAMQDGSVWMAASNGLNRWANGRITFHGTSSTATRDLRGGSIGRSSKSVLDAQARSLGVDDEGRLWAATRNGMFVLEADRFDRVPGLPPTNANSIVPDGHGGMWIAAEERLLHWSEGQATGFPWTQFAGGIADSLVPDSSRQAVWLGSLFGGVSYFENGRVLASFTPADGLGSGRVIQLRRTDDGAVWAATEGGLSRIADGHVATLTAKNGLPCDAVHWSIEDDLHSVWLYMACGVVRVPRADLDAWVRDPRRRVEPTLFDASDGVGIIGFPGSYGPMVTKSPDGKIWFTSSEGVTVIDPGNVRRNEQPPPVHIEQIQADGTTYDASRLGSGPLRLPPRVRDLGIDYTALSLRVPEKVRFRIKLEGQDKDWQELLNVRHVHYTNLPPKSYRFLVKAANDSGVWNEQGAVLAFTIPPAFYETTWFRALCLAAVLATFGAVYRIRIGALEARRRLLERHQAEITALNDGLMKAQEEERTRISGELHDGVLQQLTTATLNLATVKYQVPSDSPAKAEIAKVQQEMIDIGTGIRHLSHELHPSVLNDGGLPTALSSYCSEFSKVRGIPVSCEADGSIDKLSPGTALALYRIAQEALGNVAKHSRAKQARVQLERAEGRVRLKVSDDGLGFEPGRAYDSSGIGLVNMRERVRRLNGTFEIETEPGRGTTIRAEVPFRPA